MVYKEKKSGNFCKELGRYYPWGSESNYWSRTLPRMSGLLGPAMTICLLASTNAYAGTDTAAQLQEIKFGKNREYTYEFGYANPSREEPTYASIAIENDGEFMISGRVNTKLFMYLGFKGMSGLEVYGRSAVLEINDYLPKDQNDKASYNGEEIVLGPGFFEGTEPAEPGLERKLYNIFWSYSALLNVDTVAEIAKSKMLTPNEVSESLDKYMIDF